MGSWKSGRLNSTNSGGNIILGRSDCRIHGMGLKLCLENSWGVPSRIERLNEGVRWYSQGCQVTHRRQELAGIRGGFEG